MIAFLYLLGISIFSVSLVCLIVFSIMQKPLKVAWITNVSGVIFFFASITMALFSS
jgi:hypothetical protein